MSSKKIPQTILIAPLNWGLGHATRCIPIIETLLEKGAKIVLAGDGRSLELLKYTYPYLPYFRLPAYAISYSRGNSQIIAMVRQFPKLLKAIKNEHRALTEIVDKNQIDIIISDNRYGIWHSEIPSIFVCHQLNIYVPNAFSFLSPWLYRFHLRQISNFDQCWIPDIEGSPNLSYNLSHRYPLPPNFKFIGPLSRFEKLSKIPSQFSSSELNHAKPDIAIVLSGPEPQRTILEEIITKQAKKLQRNCWIIQGKTEVQEIFTQKNIWKISYMDTKDMFLLLSRANVIISRPGYSSLMDYAALGLKQMIFIPTPGQTEQEYLATQLLKQNIAYTAPQKHINIEEALKEVETCYGFVSRQYASRLGEMVEELFNT